MKIKYQLWSIFSVLFIAVALTVYFVVSTAYEQRLQRSFEQVAIVQGSTILDQLSNTYPDSPNRSIGYLQRFSDELESRIVILNEEYRVFGDSFRQLEANTALNLESFNLTRGNVPSSSFTKTEFGYIQYTIIELVNVEPQGYILMVQEANGLYDELRSFRNWIIQILIVAVLTFFLISYLVSSWFTRPIEKIIERVKRITPQQRDFSLRYSRKDEIKNLIDTIADMVEELNLYDERQRRFLSTSSHELKTPLATMQLIVENLPYVREEVDSHDEYVEDLYFQVQKMRVMVDQLLKINKLWISSIEKERVKKEEIQNYILQSFSHLAENKDILLEFDINVNHIYVDKGLFLRGLENLISNSIRYSPTGKKVNIKIEGNSMENKISVCDQGIGIAAENIPHIFEPFYRSNDATIWNQEGTGLGLTIVKQIIDRHKGRIEVDSQVNKGTCIHITIPNE